jgi:hypothetical protein
VACLVAAPFFAAAIVLALIAHGGTSTPKGAPASAPTPAGCDTSQGRTLTKLGATPLDWAAHHVATYDPPSGPQTRWDARPDLPRFRGHEGAVYNDTRFYTACVAGSYYIQLARPAADSAALRRGLEELPSDARVISRRSRPRCMQYGVRSERLIEALHARDNYPPTTRVLIELPHRRGARGTQRIGLAIVLQNQVDRAPCTLSG